jgi:hypothetical protein
MKSSLRETCKSLFVKFFNSFTILFTLTTLLISCEKLNDEDSENFIFSIECNLCIAIESPQENNLTFLRGVPVKIDINVTFDEVVSGIDLDFYYKLQGEDSEELIGHSENILTSASPLQVSSNSFTPESPFFFLDNYNDRDTSFKLYAALRDATEERLLSLQNVAIKVIASNPTLGLKDEEITKEYLVEDQITLNFESYLDPFLNQFKKVEFYKSDGISDPELIETISKDDIEETALKDFEFNYTFEEAATYSFFARMHYTSGESNAPTEAMIESEATEVLVRNKPAIRISLPDDLKNEEGVYELSITEPFGFRIFANNFNGIENVELKLLNSQNQNMLDSNNYNFNSNTVSDDDLLRVANWVSDLAVLIPGVYTLYATMLPDFESEKITVNVLNSTQSITAF